VGTLPQLDTYYLSNILYAYVPRRKGFPSGLPLWWACLAELSCAWGVDVCFRSLETWGDGEALVSVWAG